MIAIDASILVRYFTQDDAAQSALANTLIETELSASNPGWVSLVALVELHWVLTRKFGISTGAVEGAIVQLLSSRTIVIERADLVDEAIKLSGTGFADRLIYMVGRSEGCTRTLTFDRRFARLAGVDLLKSR